MAKKKYISLNNLTTFFNNLKGTFATKIEVENKSNKIHTHSVSDITNLQSALDGKASTSHGTHVTFSTTSPAMDGTASIGSATTVARSDHKHPTDTSRASQTGLDSHISNTTTHITSTERTNWNASYTHSQSAHAPSTAEPNQNAFSNVKIGDVTIAADIKTDTLTLVAGNNITLTPDATNDQITISAKDTTYTLGSFGITATAAELNKLDGVTATATEINYVDGVTSNIQTQLDGKSASGHTHNYAGSSSVGGAATSANKLNTDAGSATQPVYFANGVPVATTYTLGKSVPNNAVFTDTHYTSKNTVGTAGVTSNTTTALTNGNVYLNSIENGTVTSSHKISGSGATTVTTDTSGNIIISSTDNNTTYSAAGSALGLVKSGGDVTISSGVITVNDDSHNHTIANIDNLQTTLDGKQTTISGGASTITSANLTSNRALVSNSSGKVAVSAVTSTELEYLDGVTSNVQTQLDGKAPTSHTHSYAGSSSVGGSATSAVKLDTSTAGDANTPVYFSGGKPVACTSLDLNTSGSSASCTGNSATATKLQTARNIGKASFNGTADITLDAIAGRAVIKSSASSYINQYTKFASIDVSSGAYTDCSGTLEFCPTEASSVFGELAYYFRTSSTIETTSISMYWKTLTNIDYANRVSAVKVSNGIYDLYYKPIANWDTMSITNVNCYNQSKITLYSNQAYVETITAAATSSLRNVSNSATTATNVAWSGVTSKPSYYDAKAIKGITRSGTTFTYTCMDGTTGTFTQQDNNTTYSVATASANGLMSSSDKSKLDGMALATVSEVKTYLGI